MPPGFRIQMLPCPDNPSQWLPPALTLAADQVDIWRAHTQMHRPEIAYLRNLLASDELGRADRFRFDRDRDQYTIARGLLRMIIAAYLGIAPREAIFQYSPNGKPALEKSPAPGRLHFNVAHSGEVILLAFAWNRQIGIDVEKIRADVEVDDLAERYFSAYERKRLRSFAADHRQTAFFECWARKEALIKATGDGLSVPLQSFDVFSPHDRPLQLLRTETCASPSWWIDSLSVAPGYAAALAVEETAGSCELQRKISLTQ